MQRILSVASLIFFLNLPFGYWRANMQKFSRGWFLSVHAPVPLVIILRLASGLGWQFATFPFMLGAFFGGQLAGGGIRSLRGNRPGARISSCLIWDLIQSRRDRKTDLS